MALLVEPAALATTGELERAVEDTSLHLKLLQAAVAMAGESLGSIDLLTDAIAEAAAQTSPTRSRYSRRSAGLPRLGDDVARQSISAVAGFRV